MDIKSIPAGSRCLVDSNIFIYHFAGLSADCTDLMVRIGAYELQGVVTTTIIAEVLHKADVGGGPGQGADYRWAAAEETESKPTNRSEPQ